MKKVLFKETQQFRQWWYILLIFAATVPVMIMSIYTLYMQTVKGVQIGESPAPNAVLIVVFFAMCIAIWVIFSLKLEVWIDQDGIHYRFFPVIFKNRLISKAEIQRYEIRKYSPILDYGGWGIRYGLGRKWGKAYNVCGNIGLQLYLTNGKKVLFGTQRSQAIMYAMDEMMKSKK
ncbi:MAG: hypothetical protein Q8S54_17110 [Bacteroidota bacterium]|nr:hypothetical protein [Odoribacter sp.]MDP3644889.1 hypothetical protein [Bacteroidota bacterium]